MSYSPDDVLTPPVRVAKAILAGGVALGLACVFLLSPETVPWLRCSFFELTGHRCLTCGLTRSLSAISHGDLQVALHFHLMGPILFGGMILAGSLWVVEASTGKRFFVKAGPTIRRNFVPALTLLWIVYGGVRLLTEMM